MSRNAVLALYLTDGHCSAVKVTGADPLQWEIVMAEVPLARSLADSRNQVLLKTLVRGFTKPQPLECVVATDAWQVHSVAIKGNPLTPQERRRYLKSCSSVWRHHLGFSESFFENQQGLLFTLSMVASQFHGLLHFLRGIRRLPTVLTALPLVLGQYLARDSSSKGLVFQNHHQYHVGFLENRQWVHYEIFWLEKNDPRLLIETLRQRMQGRQIPSVMYFAVEPSMLAELLALGENTFSCRAQSLYHRLGLEAPEGTSKSVLDCAFLAVCQAYGKY